MSNDGVEPPADGERAERLARAVECLDMVDRRVAERCSVSALQDVVGNLLLMLARIGVADVAGGRSAGDMISDCRALARESLMIAGIPASGIDAAVSAVTMVDRLGGLKHAARD